MKSRPKALTLPDGVFVVASDDGVVRFKLCRTPGGLLVQRERQNALSHSRLVHSAVFADTLSFSRWCDADSVRFDYPIVHSAVSREGEALLHANDDAAKPHSHHSER